MAWTDIGDAVTGEIAEASWGDAVRANFLEIGPHVRRYKSENQAFISTTTYANVNDFSFPIAANEAWAIDVYLEYIIDLDGDMKLKWTLPAGFDTDSSWSGFYMAAGTNTPVFLNPTALDSDLIFVITSTTSGWARLNGTIINGSTAGTAQIQAAQVVSDPGGANLFEGSWLVGHQVLTT